MSETIEVQLVEMTATALHDVPPALEEFRRIFLDISNAIDDGEDAAALQALQKVTPPLRDFAKFCAALLDQSLPFLPLEVAEDLVQKCQSFSAIVETIVKEGEAQNLVELGDVLRFEMCDLMQDFTDVFSRMHAALQQYQAPDPSASQS